MEDEVFKWIGVFAFAIGVFSIFISFTGASDLIVSYIFNPAQFVDNGGNISLNQTFISSLGNTTYNKTISDSRYCFANGTNINGLECGEESPYNDVTYNSPINGSVFVSSYPSLNASISISGFDGTGFFINGVNINGGDVEGNYSEFYFSGTDLDMNVDLIEGLNNWSVFFINLNSGDVYGETQYFYYYSDIQSLADATEEHNLKSTWLEDIKDWILDISRTLFYTKSEVYNKSEIDNRYSNNTGDQDLSGLVPYTGATGNVNLGTKNLVGATVSSNSSTNVAGAGLVIGATTGDAIRGSFFPLGSLSAGYRMAHASGIFQIQNSAGSVGFSQFGTNVGIGTTSQEVPLQVHGSNTHATPSFSESLISRNRGQLMLWNDNANAKITGITFETAASSSARGLIGLNRPAAEQSEFFFSLRKDTATSITPFWIKLGGTQHIDNYKAYFGDSLDSSITYDGTNMIFNPKEVGSGILDVAGTLQTDGYNSADGSAGITTTFVDNDGNTIGVKDGLIVSKTAP